MCLNIVEKRQKLDKRIIPAWKIFDSYGLGLEFVWCRFHSSWKVPIGRWIRKEGKTTTPHSIGVYSQPGKYRYGFHVYPRTTPRLLKGMVKWPVWVREVHTIGRQSGHEVIVANEMWVCPTRNRIRPRGKEILAEEGKW